MPLQLSFRFADAEAHQKRSHRDPPGTLPVFQVESLGGRVRPDTPLRIRQWGALQAKRLHVGFLDAPGIAAIGALVELIAVPIAARTAIDDQRAVLLVLEEELLNRADAGFAENRVLPPGLSPIGGLQQERVLRQRI